MYDRFTYGPSDPSGTYVTSFSSEQSEDEDSLHNTLGMMGLGGSGECSRKHQATSTLDDQGLGYHPILGDSGVSPRYSIPGLSQDENPYLNGNVDLNKDMEFVVETQDDNQHPRPLDFFPV